MSRKTIFSEQDIRLIYRAMGLKGLEAIPDIGAPLGGKIERMILERETGSASGQDIRLMHPNQGV